MFVSEQEKDAETLELGRIKARIDNLKRRIELINVDLVRNQREINNIKDKEDQVRSRLGNLQADVVGLGSTIDGDIVDQSSMLSDLEDLIEEDGLKFGRWLLKTGPCENFFIKDTKRGGWYKFGKTCECDSVYGEPTGEMLDVNTQVTSRLVPNNCGCCGCCNSFIEAANSGCFNQNVQTGNNLIPA